jgi:hypothetical protein
MAELNFGLLTPPGSESIGNAFVRGLDQAQASQMQNLQMQQSVRQGQMAELQYKKALDTEARLSKYYADIAANGGPKTPQEAIQAMLGSGVPHIQDLAAKLQVETLKNQQEIDMFNAAKIGPKAPAVAAPMAPPVTPEPGSFSADVAARKEADPFRVNMMPGAATVNNLGGRTIDDMIAERDRMIRVPGKAAEHQVTALNADILRASRPQTQIVDGQVIERQSDGTYRPVFGEKKAPPIIELKKALAAMAPDDPDRPAIQAEIDKALTAQKQGEERNRIARARFNIEQNKTKLGLAEADVPLIMDAVESGRLNPDKLNGQTATIYASVLRKNPLTDFVGASNTAAAARTGAVTGARIASRQFLTDVDATRAENIAKGNLPPATGLNADKIMNEVLKLNPEYNSRDFGLQTKAESAFNTGKQGDKARSLNVAVSHLATLDSAAAALASGNIPALNQFSQAWQRETGKVGATSFNAVKELVADEIVAAVVPGVGALADRKALKDTIMSKSSPAQLQGVIKEYKELLGGQLGGLEKQYGATTRKTDFRQRYLTPAATSALTSPAAATPSAGWGKAEAK